jgi:hypothetical protein
MKFWCVLVALLAAAGPAFTGQANAPSVHFENTTGDAGTVAQGEIIKQVFTFMNNGPGILKILDIGQS